MKKINTLQNNSKLAAYSAMAAAFVAVGTNAGAAPIYRDIDDIFMDLNSVALIDMDENGTFDFQFMNLTDSFDPWSFVWVVGYSTAYSYGTPLNMVIGFTGPVHPYASALNYGDTIDAADFFISNSYNKAYLASVNAGITYGPFAGAIDKYLGVKFVIDGSLHYGWIRFDVSVSPTSVTIKDLAYDDIPDEAIDAGRMAGVGIRSLTDEQIHAYSNGNTISILINDPASDVSAVNIFDITGKLVYTNALSSNDMSINLSNAATGLYTLQLVSAGNSIYTKKLFIRN